MEFRFFLLSAAATSDSWLGNMNNSINSKEQNTAEDDPDTYCLLHGMHMYLFSNSTSLY